MVNWIDEPDDEEDDFVYCYVCGSALSVNTIGACPVCGAPLGVDAPDAAAVDALQKCGDEYAEHEGNAT